MKHLKQEFDKLSFKDALMYALAVVCLTASFVLLFMGMLIPPEGEIHETVLTAFGMVLIFVGTIFGISFHYAGKLDSFQRTIINLIKEQKGGDDVDEMVYGRGAEPKHEGRQPGD